MSAIILNGTTYSGGANPYPPSKIEEVSKKVGKTLIMASGVRAFVGPGTVKEGWKLSWEVVNTTTRAAAKALVALTATFTYTDEFGVGHTAQCEADDQTRGTAFTKADNSILYDLQLTIWQGN